MTCIVGLIDNGRIFMGGDSQGTSGSYKGTLKTKKVFQNGEFLIGYTTSYRMGQLLQHSFNPPIPKEDQDILTYMTTDFINAIRDCMKKGGYAKCSNGEESGGTFLVGFRGRLFEIQDDFSVLESEHAFNSVGCGSSFALGSLISTETLPPKARISMALSAAETFSSGVGGPMYILESEGG